MKVIVTGGSGRVGKAVIHALAARGHELINIDRQPAYDRPAKFIYMDLRQRELLQPVMQKAEAVIHMGEIPSVRAYGFNAPEVFGQNCQAGSQVLQIAAELNYQRILYVSSIQAYGFAGEESIPWAVCPADESHPLRPQNAYAAGKSANEMYARMLVEKKKCSISVFRLPGVICREVTPRWLEWTDTNNHYLPEDLGVQIKDSDVAEALALALEKQRPGFEAYNLSCREVTIGMPLTWAQAKLQPDRPRLPADWPKFKSPYLWDKAREHLGWQPKWNFLDIFREKYGRDPQPKLD